MDGSGVAGDRLEDLNEFVPDVRVVECCVFSGDAGL